jgi:hypothetical protein
MRPHGFGRRITGRPGGRLPRSLVVSALILLLALSLPAFGADPSYLQELLERARSLRLADHPYWRTLGHYKASPFGVRSLVDDPDFFLSPAGRRNPEAELEATLAAFFAPEEPGVRHPACRFIARYHWLEETLAFDPSRLPAASCDRFEEMMAAIRPVSVSLIFPSAYMNSPASMFGHTLLLLEPESDDSRLLSHAVNYAAVTPNRFGPLFAVKGLFGFYEGYFSVLPYYAKIQEYSDVDHRDIWEYPLNLDHGEVRRLMMHLYELEDVHSDYYFFDENCSYTLLFLLDAARPGLDLTDQFSPFYVIPRDTVEAAERNGLVVDRVFRPSRTTKIRALAEAMPVEERMAAVDIAYGGSPAGAVEGRGRSERQRARMLDLASEYVRYLYTRDVIDQPVFQRRYLGILGARSRIDTPPDDAVGAARPPAPPEEGHRPGRIGIGIGAEDGEPFLEARLRPANHELIDDDAGYQAGGQIVFGESALRYFPGEDRWRLHRLDLIDILSIAPRDELFQPISWKVKTGFRRHTLEDGDDHLVWTLGGGAGVAYSSRLLGLWYLMLESDLNAGGALQDSYALGFGASAGLVRPVNAFWKIQLSVEDIAYVAGESRNAFAARFRQNFALTRQISLSTDFLRRCESDVYRSETLVSLNYYF